MKKFYLTMFAMLCGVAAMAENKVFANSIENAAPGSTQKLEIQFETEESVVLKSFGFRLEMPEGFKAKAKSNITLGRLSEECEEEEYFGVEVINAADGNKMYAAYLTNNEVFQGNSGVIMTIPFTIDAAVAEGVYNIKLYRGDLGITNTDNYEAVIPVGVGKPTGITTATADDANAPIYNVAGQIVSKAQKGIYIQNGKKVLK